MAPSSQHQVAVGDRDPFDEFNRAMGATGRTSPYPELADFRRQGPLLGGAFGVPPEDTRSQELDDLPEVFTAYTFDAVHEILGDGLRFSSTGYAAVMGQVMGHSILEMDEPEHHTYRSLIQQAFTRKAMERWEHDLVGPIVNRMIDGFIDDGRTDLVRNLMFPFPVTVIAGMLGLPEADLPRFHRLAVELIGVGIDWDCAVEASGKLGEYFAGILAERRAAPSNDMMSVLAAAEMAGTSLTDEEIFSFLRLLLPAGAETTYRSSSNLLFGLLSDPAQLDAVRGDRSLVPQAIEEGIRWEAPLLSIMRTVDLRHRGVRRADQRQGGHRHQPRVGQPRRDPLGRSGAVRHLPRAQAPHRVRLGPAHVPRDASRPNGDQGRARRAARPPAQPALRSRRRPLHLRPHLPGTAHPRRRVGLTGRWAASWGAVVESGS